MSRCYRHPEPVKADTPRPDRALLTPPRIVASKRYVCVFEIYVRSVVVGQCIRIGEGKTRGEIRRTQAFNQGLEAGDGS